MSLALLKRPRWSGNYPFSKQLLPIISQLVLFPLIMPIISWVTNLCHGTTLIYRSRIMRFERCRILRRKIFAKICFNICTYPSTDMVTDWMELDFWCHGMRRLWNSRIKSIVPNGRRLSEKQRRCTRLPARYRISTETETKLRHKNGLVNGSP